MEDSTKIVRPHKDYVKHGRPAKRARKSHPTTKAANSQPQAPQGLLKIGHNNNKPTAIPRPISKSKLISSKGFDKIRIVRLLLAGVAPKDIADKMGITVNQCQNITKEIEKDIEDLTIKEYLSLLLSKVRLLLDNHTQSSADIQLSMLDIELLIKQVNKRLSIETDQDKLRGLRKELVSLTRQRLTIIVDLNANNTALTTNLSKMGVTNVPTSSKNKEPTPSSIGGEIPRLEELPESYRDMDKEALLGAMRDSNRDVGRYLRAERDRKKQGSE